MARRLDRRRLAWTPVMVGGLLIVECALVGEVGSPGALLRVLRDLGGGGDWTDPVAPVLSLMALVVELLAAYVLAVLVLGWLCLLPGSAGRIAGRVAFLVTPLVVRRFLDLLVGGTLLAQATLAATPPSLATAAPTVAASAPGSREPYPAAEVALPHWPVQVLEPVETRPNPRRSAVPLPPWLGGGPSNAPPGSTGGDPATLPTGRPGAGLTGGPGPGYIVEVGDTLWDIAAAHLPAAERSAANVQRYWRQIHRANRAAIGADPDLIHPGTRLELPPFRRDRR